MGPIQFGILAIPYQLIDVAGPIDVLSSSSKPYLQGHSGLSAEAAASGLDIEFHHIGDDLEPVALTGNFQCLPTTTCSTCPRLDYLLVGGPSPAFVLSPVMADFLRDRAKEVKILFSTCTGGLVLASAGVLDGRNATVNHGVFEMGKKMFPQVRWTKESQWVMDGNLWTAREACAGMDMMAHWVISTCGKIVAQSSFEALDYHPRDRHGKALDIKSI